MEPYENEDDRPTAPPPRPTVELEPVRLEALKEACRDSE